MRWLTGARLDLLTDVAEVAFLRRIALDRCIVGSAAPAHEPHGVASYPPDSAVEFDAQWARGKDSPHLRFIIQDDPTMTVASLALMQGVVTVLASGLGLFGAEAPE